MNEGKNLNFEKKIMQVADEIPIYRNGELTKVMLHELRLQPPDSSILQVLGDTGDFRVGDRIQIGTGVLIFYGRVVGRNMNGDLLSSIEIAFLMDRSKHVFHEKQEFGLNRE